MNKINCKFTEGYEAGEHGATASDNPYTSKQERIQWLKGWAKSQKDFEQFIDYTPAKISLVFPAVAVALALFIVLIF